jgi:methyl-accepting chemotaxis protein
MKRQTRSLRSQFLFRLFITLLLIVIISGALQLYLMKGQISDTVKNKSAILSQSVEQGMEETKLASESIEHQIDLRIVSYAKQIAAKLKGKTLEDISADELLTIKDELDLAGITLFAKKNDDIVGVKSTDPDEVGFSFKKIGYSQGYEALNGLYTHNPVDIGATYMNKNFFVLPISQSGSHDDKPIFFKYGYYLAPGTSYIINPYIEANEVYQFTSKIGPDAWIKKMQNNNPTIKEVAVLDPSVFENPELETKLYPPVKKVAFGKYSYKDSKDEKLLIDMAENGLKKVEYTKTYKDDKVYKMFAPTKEGRVIYTALDYGALSGPLYRHSIVLIVSGVVSLIALFLLTARFFNHIYEKIQRIKSQIEPLENGDLTVKNSLKDDSELGDLSQGVNRVVDKLNKLVTDTQAQATKTQRLSVLLEAEASQSVEKIYEVSTEATIKAREQLYEITEFLNDVEQALQPYSDNEKTKEILAKLDAMKEVANERTAATTNMTITLSDLLQSLHDQSSELSDISNTLLEHMSKFKL